MDDVCIGLSIALEFKRVLVKMDDVFTLRWLIVGEKCLCWRNVSIGAMVSRHQQDAMWQFLYLRKILTNGDLE